MRILLILHFLVIALYTKAQFEFNVDIIDNTVGLSSDKVQFIFQDSDGCMWFGTHHGLNQYNGYEVNVLTGFNNNEEYTNFSFESMAEDQHGILWIGTSSSGILLYNKQTRQIKPFHIEDINPRKKSIIKLYYDSRDNMWITTQEKGLYKFNTTSKQLNSYKFSDDPHSFVYSDVTDIVESKNGEMWIGTWEGYLSRYSPQNDNFTNYQDDRFKIYSLCSDSRNVLWIGTWGNGLLKVDSVISGKVYYDVFSYHQTKPNTISGNIIYTINEDIHQNIWIGTPFGFDILKPAGNNKYSIDNYNSKNSLKSLEEVICIHHSDSGITWLSIIDNGINKIERKRSSFEIIKIPEINKQRRNQTIVSLFPINTNEYYIGIKSLGFMHCNLTKPEFTSFRDIAIFSNLNPYFNSVLCFYKDNNNHTWFGTRYSGVYWLDENNDILKKINLERTDKNMDNNQINSITMDNDGIIWLGTRRGLFRLIDSKDNDYPLIEYCSTFKKKPEIYIGAFVNTVFCDSRGTLWIGSKFNGLARYCGNDSFEYFQRNESLSNSISSNEVLSILEDATGRLWIGHSKGIDLMDVMSGTFTNYSKDEGLFGDIVYSIVEADTGELWLGTNRGIAKFSPDKEVGFQFENYTVDDGLPSNIYMPNSVLKNNNELIFGSSNGIVKFNPKRIKTNKYAPPAVITDIWITNKWHPFDLSANEIILTHRDYIFTIGFDSYSYSQSYKNKFAYRLLGFNDIWTYTDASNRKAYFSNLDAGTYVFEVKASNSSGLWNHRPTLLNIVVLPPPYLSWWAIVLYCIGGIIIAISIYKVLSYYIRMRHTIKLHGIKQQFFINVSHELLTPLSIISALSEKITSGITNAKNLELLTNNTKRLHHLIKQLLDFRKTETTTMKLQISYSDMVAYLKKMMSSFDLLASKTNIKFEKKLPDQPLMVYFDMDKLDKIMHNLISNAFKYTPSGGLVTVSMEQELIKSNLYVKLIVSDNGRGIRKEEMKHIFERFYRAGNQANEGLGIGLALTKRLVELHKGTIKVDSKINSGTTFTVQFPVHKEAFSASQFSPDKDETNISSFVDIPLQDKDSTKIDINKNKYTVLVVEDNDDLRSLLFQYLSENYNVLLANNGKDAFKIIKKKQPTVVVSDVMMPIWDGMKLCKEVKTNIETSHIPIILLTAKDAEDSRIDGYTYGADSYLTKPVNFKVVATRIDSLLSQRKRLQDYLQGKEHMPPIDINIPTIDDKFIKDAQTVVSKNFHLNEFTTDQFAKEMNISISLLYLKMKNIMGLTPLNYIKKHRLEVAAELLQKGIKVADVSFHTGFKEISHFSSCFKNKYGKTPSSYASEALSPNESKKVINKA